MQCPIDQSSSRVLCVDPDFSHSALLYFQYKSGAVDRELFNMPVSKAGSPTKMVQQSGKPPVAATEADNQNKITNEHIKEQDKKEVSCQS